MWTAIKTVVLTAIMLAAIFVLPFIWIILLVLIIGAIAYVLVTDAENDK